jgi:FkbM family methyltransferase
MIPEVIGRLPNFINRFGLRSGLRLGLNRSGRGIATDLEPLPLSVPDHDLPIWLRSNRSDHSIFWQTVVRKQYDLGRFPQFRALEQRARAMLAQGKVPVIVDGGANIGLSLRTFAQDFPFAHVIAVEPDSDNLRVLRANADGLATAHDIVQAGIAGRSGHCRVVSRERGSAGLQTAYCEASHPEAIRTCTIPELVAMVPNGVPWIVKLDIEGAQDELFSVDTEWVGTVDLIILELDDWAFPWSGSSVNFFRALSQHRFDYLLADELILAFRHREE